MIKKLMLLLAVCALIFSFSSPLLADGDGTGGGNVSAPTFQGAFLTTINVNGYTATPGKQIDGRNPIPVNSVIELEFDKNVVADTAQGSMATGSNYNKPVWSTNQQLILLETSSGTRVSATLFRLGDTSQPDPYGSSDVEKRNIFLRPNSSLAPGQHYQIIIKPGITAFNGLSQTQQWTVNFTTAESSNGGTTNSGTANSGITNNGSASSGSTRSGTSNTESSSDTQAPTWADSSSVTTSNLTDSELTLTWTAATDKVGVTGYRIYQNGTLITTVKGNTRSYNVTGLKAKSQYTYLVTAGDAAGWWSRGGPSVTATTPAPDTQAPAWPAGSSLRPSNITATGLTLSWTAALDGKGVTGYRVYQDGVLLTTVTGGATGPTATGNTMSFSVTGLTASTHYTFKVEAGNGAGLWSQTGPKVDVTTTVSTSTAGSESKGEGNKALTVLLGIILTVIVVTGVGVFVFKRKLINLGSLEKIWKIRR